LRLHIIRIDVPWSLKTNGLEAAEIFLIKVVDGAAEYQCPRHVRIADTQFQRGLPAVTVTKDHRFAQVQRPDKGGGIIRQQPVAEFATGISALTMPPCVQRNHPEMLRQRRNLFRPRLHIGGSAMQQDKRLAAAVFLVMQPDVTDVYELAACHRYSSLR